MESSQRVSVAEEYRVEVPSFPERQIVLCTRDRQVAVQTAQQLGSRAYVWAMGAKMIVFRNWQRWR